MTDKTPEITEQQKFLDSSQYTQNGILKYEFIFGEGYISSGGAVTTNEILDMIELDEGSNALDIGCGIGGGSAFLSDRFKCNVLGIDLSENAIGIAKKKYADKKLLKFAVADAVSAEFPKDHFDLIYSRDAILHIKKDDKVKLFNNIYNWLKPGGKVVITDYCCGQKEEDWEDDFKEYIKNRRYTLVSVEAYKNLLADAKLKVETAKDNTDRWLITLKKEINRLEDNKGKFLSKFEKSDYDELHEGWKKKICRSQNGQQTWGLFIAEK